MRLPVGGQLHLDLPSLLDKKRYTVTLVGWLTDRSVLVTAPRSANVHRLVTQGDEVVLRAFCGMHAYAFHSTVIVTPTLPFHYLHLSYPTHVDSVTIRSAMRCRLRLPATLNTAGTRSDCLIRNIGGNGALLESQQVLKKGNPLSLLTAFELHGVPVRLEIVADVRSVKLATLMPSAPAQYGIEFRDLKPNDRLILGSLVNHHIYEDPECAA